MTFFSFKDNLLCESFVKRKQVKRSFKSINDVSTQELLELIYIDLFNPKRTKSLSSKRYGLVIIDDHTRWTSIIFLRNKEESYMLVLKWLKCKEGGLNWVVKNLGYL